MQIVHFDAFLRQIFAEVLGHALGERGHQHALFAALHPFLDARDEVVHLAARRQDGDDRVHQAGGADDLFHDLLAHAALECGRRGRGIYRLVDTFLEFREAQGAVVRGRWQAETVFDERAFARGVAFEHAADLRHGHVRFVDDRQEVRLAILGPREIVQEGVRRRAARAPGKGLGIVLDAVAVAHFLDHSDVELGAALQPLRLQKFLVLLKVFQTLFQFRADGLHRPLPFRHQGDEVLRRGDEDLIQGRRLVRHETFHRVHFVYRLDNAVAQVEVVYHLPVRWHYLPVLPTRAESTALQIRRGAVELQGHQLLQELAAVHLLAGREAQDVLRVDLRRAQAVDAGDRGHHDDVPARE